MTGEDQLRGQLLHAADEFPVRGWPADLQRRAVRRRRTVAGFAVAVGLVAAAGVAVAVPVATAWVQGPDRAPAATVSADYVGSSWRLVGVAEGANRTAVPTEVGAHMDLFTDGRLLIDDGVNALSGRFTRSGDGFEVREVGTTLAAYVGNDRRWLAAIAALNTLAYGPPNGVEPSGPARDTVVSADASRLVVQAGKYRLTFERTGPATETPQDVATASAKPS